MLNGNLEYLISSLPTLIFKNSDTAKEKVVSLFHKYANDDHGERDLVSIFNEESSKFLTLNQYEKLRITQIKLIHQKHYQESSIKVVSEFSKFMFLLKSELKSYRINRKSDSSLLKLSYEFIDEIPINPLMAEEFLIDLQWKKLEELSIDHYSDFSALLIYKLKLEVLVRLWQFNEEKGFRIFQKSLKIA